MEVKLVLNRRLVEKEHQSYIKTKNLEDSIIVYQLFNKIEFKLHKSKAQPHS